MRRRNYQMQSHNSSNCTNCSCENCNKNSLNVGYRSRSKLNQYRDVIEDPFPSSEAPPQTADDPLDPPPPIREPTDPLRDPITEDPIIADDPIYEPTITTDTGPLPEDRFVKAIGIGQALLISTAFVGAFGLWWANRGKNIKRMYG